MAQCLKPYRLKDQQIDVPCGRCPECMARRISGWSFRLMEHQKQCDSVEFVTFTYDTRFVPITPKGFMTLTKDHHREFFKKLRKLETRKIKYYLVGEYGGKKRRPHYHAIIFNATQSDILLCWPYGSVYFGYDASEAAVGYCLAYMNKGANRPTGDWDDRLPEFSNMSKGLGKSYVSSQTIKWHNAKLGERNYIPLKDGKKIAMPRYYKEKVYDETDRIIAGKIARDKMLDKPQSKMSDRDRDQAALASYRHMQSKAKSRDSNDLM